jgi:fibronectin-binding autotransporter adhesin
MKTGDLRNGTDINSTSIKGDIMSGQKRVSALIGAAAAGLVGMAGVVQAQTLTWTGAGGDNNFTTALNWADGGGQPLAPAQVGSGAAGAALIFDGSTRLNPFNDIVPGFDFGSDTGTAQQTAGSITFAAGAGAFVIDGHGLELGSTSGNPAGGITNNSSSIQTFNTAVGSRFGTFNAATADLAFNGRVHLGMGAADRSITVAGAHNVYFNGQVTGSNLIKNGAGTLFLSNDSNNYTGALTINAGAVRATSMFALGDFGSAIQVAGGTNTGRLELSGGTSYFQGRTLNLNGRQAAADADAHVVSVSGNNTWNAPITIGAGGDRYGIQSDSGLLTITGTIENNLTGGFAGARRMLNLQGAGNGNITGNIGGTAVGSWDIIKRGTGTWTLSGSNTHTGRTVVNEGTLVLSSASAVVTSSELRAAGSGIMDVSQVAGGTFNLQVDQAVTGTGTFKANTLYAFGDNMIRPGAAGVVGTLTVDGNLTLDGQFGTAAGGLYFDLSNTTTVGGGVNDLINVTGSLSLMNQMQVHINPVSGALANGTYRLIEYGGSLSGGAGNLSLIGAGSARQSLALSTATAGQVDLVVSGMAANLVWAGDGSSNTWDVGGTPNWQNNGSPDVFYDFDNVSFTNTGSATPAVNIVGTVQPGSITVDSSQNYTFAGAGAIGGAGSLTKSGTGTLTIANTGPNTFTGPITIEQGTVQVGDGGETGTLGTGEIVNNGTLAVNRSIGVTINNVISGAGGVTQLGVGTLTVGGNNTYEGVTTVSAGRTISVTHGNALGSPSAGTVVGDGGRLFVLGTITIPEPLTISGMGGEGFEGALRKGGSGTTTYSGPITLAGNAAIKVDGGGQTLNLTNAAAVTGNGHNLILRTDGGSTSNVQGRIDLGTGSLIKQGGGTWVIQSSDHQWGTTTVDGGALNFSLAADGVANLSQPVELISGSLGLAVGSGAGSVVTISGPVSGAGGINVIGGTLVLSGVNSYAGVTSVGVSNATGPGVLRLASDMALGSQGGMTWVRGGVNTGRIELTGNINVNKPMTLEGRQAAAETTSHLVNVSGNNTWSGNILGIAWGANYNIESAGGHLTIAGNITNDAPSLRILRFKGDAEGTVSGVISNGNVPMRVIKDGAGTWTLANNNPYSGGTAVNAGRLVIERANSLGTGAVTIGSAGTLAVQQDFGTHTMALPTIEAGGRLDITNNEVVLQGTSLAAANALVQSGYAGGSWTGAGINSSSAAAQSGRAVGIGTAGDDVLVKFTWGGDATLDGSVTIADLGVLAANWQANERYWFHGDFNFDGSVNIADLGILAANWQKGTSGGGMSFAEALAMFEVFNGVVIPEPSALGLVGLGALALRRRRRA